jgi:hypothetical protein
MKDPEPLSKLISLKGKKALITGSALGIGKAPIDLRKQVQTWSLWT